MFNQAFNHFFKHMNTHIIPLKNECISVPNTIIKETAFSQVSPLSLVHVRHGGAIPFTQVFVPSAAKQLKGPEAQGCIYPQQLRASFTAAGAVDGKVCNPCSCSAFHEWYYRVELAALLTLGLAVAD